MTDYILHPRKESIALVRPPEHIEPSDLSASVMPRILIIEDTDIVAELIEDALSEEGFRVVGVARTATQAISMAKDLKPHLAITDVRLAGSGDGIEAAYEMLVACGTRSIFATGYLDATVQARGAKARPAGWLSKPYSQDQLVSAVRNALATVAADA